MATNDKKNDIELSPLAFAKLVKRNEGHIRRLVRNGELPKKLTYGVAVEFANRPKKTAAKAAGSKKYAINLTPAQFAELQSMGYDVTDPGVAAKTRKEEKDAEAEAWLVSNDLSL